MTSYNINCMRMGHLHLSADSHRSGNHVVYCPRNTIAQDTTARVNQGDSHGAHVRDESKNQNPSFKDLVKGSGMGDSEAAGVQHGREPSVHWASGNSPYLSSGVEDQNSSFPYLPPLAEEPSSSFSEGIMSFINLVILLWRSSLMIHDYCVIC